MAFPTTFIVNADGTLQEVPKPLEVNFDPDEMTLDELCLFDGEGFTASGFRAFLVNHTNWTKAEVGNLKIKELKEVTEQLGAKLQARSVPLEKSPR